MQTVVGVFPSRTTAERAVEDLRASGIAISRINLLTPGASEKELAAVPLTETEQPGMGSAVGGVIGGALGAAGGVHLGTAVASALLPGVGPVVAIGAAAAALLGIGGIVGGAVAGGALEDLATEGLPKDELFIYEDALRQGRSIVIVLAEDDQAADAARGVLARAGAESLDAAREKWWLGIRDVEEEGYTAQGHHGFEAVEPTFRRGFEAALHHGTRGKAYADVLEYLRHRYPDVYADETFRRGFDRGRAYFWVIKDRQPQ